MSNANYIFFTRPSASLSYTGKIHARHGAFENYAGELMFQGADRRVEVISKLASLAKKN